MNSAARAILVFVGGNAAYEVSASLWFMSLIPAEFAKGGMIILLTTTAVANAILLAILWR